MDEVELLPALCTPPAQPDDQKLVVEAPNSEAVPDDAAEPEDADPEAELAPAWLVVKPRKRRNKSAYDMPDAAKKAFGERMRHARETCGMTLTAAAEAMGYSQPVQLSYMENGLRPITLRVLISCANLYGTTADYLAGLAADPDVDPAQAVQARLADAIAGDLQRLLAGVAAAGCEAARDIRPVAARSLRLAAATLELQRALQRLRDANPVFDRRLKGGARVVSAAEAAAELAIDLVGTIDRLQGRAKRSTLVGAALEAVKTADGRDIAGLATLLRHPRQVLTAAAIAGLDALEAEASDNSENIHGPH